MVQRKRGKDTQGPGPDSPLAQRAIEVKAHAFEPSPDRELVEGRKWKPEELIPSGSTMLNCACSDCPHGAFGTGTINTTPGSSQSGKTVLALSTFAEMNLFSRFNEYEFYFDDAEQALKFDLGKMFGPETAGRIRPPRKDKKTGEPIFSNTVQDFEGNILQLLRHPHPFIYVLDSMDSLSSDEELEKEFKKALLRETNPEKLKELAGSYHTEKARIIGETLRMINGNIKKSNSVLILIQQERDKIGSSWGRQNTTSGGRAPFFYSFHQIWLTRMAALTATVGTNKLRIGSSTKAEVTKNKLTGKERVVELDIYNDYGVDDITGCVEFLCKNHWPKQEGKELIYVAREFDVVGTTRKIIQKIETSAAEMAMRELVGVVWNEIETKALLTDRKRRFTL